jgi:hypothetical protein
VKVGEEQCQEEAASPGPCTLLVLKPSRLGPVESRAHKRKRGLAGKRKGYCWTTLFYLMYPGPLLARGNEEEVSAIFLGIDLLGPPLPALPTMTPVLASLGSVRRCLLLAM